MVASISYALAHVAFEPAITVAASLQTFQEVLIDILGILVVETILRFLVVVVKIVSVQASVKLKSGT